MSDFSKIKYWYEKLPEMKSNIEPLTQLMIRTTGEVNNYMNHHAYTKTIKIVNSKDINLLHSIDRAPAIKKLLDRVHFLKKHKEEIKMLERKNGFVDLSSELFLNSPFASINSEIIAEVANNKFVTLSGVGRIGAIKIVFPAGLRIKIIVGTVDACLKKRLISLNNMFIYSKRFSNLKKYGINEKEIIDSKRILTKKCYKRGKFIKRQSRKLLNKIIPLK
jgi:hypothetical protein